MGPKYTNNIRSAVLVSTRLLVFTIAYFIGGNAIDNIEYNIKGLPASKIFKFLKLKLIFRSTRA